MKTVMCDATKHILVVGGGPAGLSAAILAGQAGWPVVLVERERVLGGMLNRLFRRYPQGDDPLDVRDRCVRALAAHPRITVLTETTVAAAEAAGKTWRVMTRGARDTRAIEAGAVILATGGTLMDVAAYGEYGYGIYPGVITALELEERLKTGRLQADTPPRAVAFIGCVGSRDRARGYPYCSKICCMYTAKQAGILRELYPAARIHVFYLDCRVAGKGREEGLREVIERHQVRYVRGRPAKVLPENGRLIVRAEDTLMGIPIETAADLVVLAPAVAPHPESAALAARFGLAAGAHGFLEDGPFPSTTGRVFTAGGCRFALDIDEAMEQGMAAAGRALALLQGEGAV